MVEMHVSNEPELGAARPIRVGVIGATGYAGGELIRLLARHPNVQLHSLAARGRQSEQLTVSHPHLGTLDAVIDEELDADVDAVFLALPHGAAAALAPEFALRGIPIVDLGPDFRLRDPADYPRWYGFEHPRPELLANAVYGLPELHRADLVALRAEDVRIVGAPGCYPTAALLALAPLARAGLLDDVVIDAKSGVSGAGREVKPEMQFSVINESVRAYGVTGHRHGAEIEQELQLAAAHPMDPVDFLPHLIPMTRGLLAACHIRPTRHVDQAELDEIFGEAYSSDSFVQIVNDPPSTKHVTGSNMCQVFVHSDDRTGRVLVISVIDNLVKGAAGQAIQAFNVLFDLPEESGLEQLPLAP